jgi:cell shape-determining protein MreC
MFRDHWFPVLVAAVFAALLFLEPTSGLFLWRAIVGSNTVAPDNGVVNTNVTQAEADALKNAAAQFVRPRGRSVEALVYSTYPLSFKNELIIAAGAREGISAGEPVLFRGLLVGKVAKVNATDAVVQTIFDTNFNMPVRIGKNSVDSLLKGGNTPLLTLIPKGKSVSEGGAVYSAATGLPYGVAIGSIVNIRSAADNVFAEAEVRPPYGEGDIRLVSVLLGQ